MPLSGRLTLVASIAVMLLPAAPSQAQQDFGHKTLGTLGLDAGSQPESGLYVADGILFYGANQLKDRNGNRVPMDIDLSVFANGLGARAVLKLRSLATYLSASISLPIAHVSLGTDRPEASIDRFGLGDLYVQPIKLGWRLPRLDLVTGYAFYAPTGDFEPGGRGSVGRGQWTHEFSAGGTVYFDRERTWNLSALASYELNERKRGIDITRGDTIQIQGGVAKRLFRIVEVGLAGYAQWQVADDRGADLPQALRGARDRAYGLGPEVDVFFAPIRTKLTLRYEHDFAVQSRPQGHILVIGLTIAALGG
jgi:hypothetical protein